MANASTGMISCEGRVRQIGDRTIVRLPDEASQLLPSRGQVAVTGTLNGQPYDTVLEPDGRRGHWVRLVDSVRDQVGLADGDVATLEFVSAGEWPEPQVPADFAAALDDADDIAEVWTDITPMARWEWVRWINATANPVTRDRRVEVGISKLRSGKRRPCCFDLASCTDPELSKSGKLVETG
ncbi:YdeI/OmpD-associated family protein [Microlunatus sp. Y2014]|uniref:YdeI/OmpD-associated family protein n=1 Tax=Microlunatus sp. Y2014 TaxID=3418488 RepID=UPI003DA7546D